MLKILFLPFRLIWAFIGAIFGFLGFVISAIVGIMLMGVGGLLTVTIVGAIVGVPLIIAGALLILKAIFG